MIMPAVPAVAGRGRVSTLAPPSHSFTLSLFLDLSYGLVIKSFLAQLDVQTSVLILLIPLLLLFLLREFLWYSQLSLAIV